MRITPTMLVGCVLCLWAAQSAVTWLVDRAEGTDAGMRSADSTVFDAESDRPADRRKWIAQSRVNQAYELQTDRWLEFNLAARPEGIRVVSHANLGAVDTPPPEVPLKYSLEFQVAGENDSIVHSGIYRHATKLTRYRDPESNEIYASAFYLNQNEIPSDRRALRLNLKDLPPDIQVTRLRLRLESRDPEILAVFARVHVPEEQPEHRRSYLWNRFNRRQRERLARGNVYPPDLLTADEKVQAVRVNWTPRGPAGIEGEDYRSVELYSIEEHEGEIVSPPLIPNGLFFDAQLAATFSVPPGGQQLSLAIQPVDDAGIPGGDITVTWHGKRPTQSTTTILKPREGLEHSTHFGEGIVELRSNSPYVARIYARNQEQEQYTDVTPQPLRVRMYQFGPAEPLAYELNHYLSDATPVRLDFCHYTIPSPAAGTDGAIFASTVRYSFVAQDGKVLKSGSLVLDNQPSRYDYFVGEEIGASLTERHRVFFDVNARVKTILLESDSPVWVAAYNRPATLRKLTNVPEDYASDTFKERQRTWFSIRPPGNRNMVVQNRTRLLAVALRPREERPELAAGLYAWESFRPINGGTGRYLLAPRDPDVQTREEALGSVFHPLQHGEPVDWRFESNKRLATTQPRILYRRNNDDPFLLNVSVNGRPVLQRQLTGYNGQFELPPITEGLHRIRCLADTGEVELFMNHRNTEAAGALLRFAIRLENETLSFDYQKVDPDKETLSLIFFTNTEPADDRSRISVRLEPDVPRLPGPVKDFTLDNRVYSVKAPWESESDVIVLDSDERQVGAGAPFFFPMHADLVPGDYRVHIQLEDGPPGYVLLYRLTPGDHEKREVVLEGKPFYETD